MGNAPVHGQFTGLDALAKPIFTGFVNKEYEIRMNQLARVCNVTFGTGDHFFDLQPVQYVAEAYNNVDDRLRNLLTAPYRPRRLATQADVNSGITKLVNGAEVPVAVGDLITDPNVRKEQSISTLQRKARTSPFGIQTRISRQLQDELDLNAPELLIRQMSTALQYTIDLVILSALYGFNVKEDGSFPVPNIQEYFTNPDGALSSDGTVRLGYSDYDRLSPIPGSSTSRSFLMESLLSAEVGRFSFVDIISARAHILRRAYLRQTAPLAMVIHPERFADLYQDDDYIRAVSFTSSDAVTSGRIQMIGGTFVIQTPHCARDIMTIFTSGSIGLVTEPQPRVGSDIVVEQAGALILAIWLSMGSVVLNESEILHVRLRTS